MKAIAVAALVVTLVLIAGMMLLAALNPDPRSGEAIGDVVMFALLGVAYGGVGALIVYRTNHAIGWLFLVIALGFTTGILMERWAVYTTEVCRGCLPLLEPVVPVGTLLFSGAIASLVGVFHLFPSGRLPPWHGRLIARALIVSTVIWTVTLNLRPSDPSAALPNPYAIESLRVPLLVVFAVGVVGSLLSAAAAIVGLVKRYRRAQGAERQQMKWLSYVGVLAATLFVIEFPLGFVFGQQSAISNALWSMFFVALMLGIPLAVGFAILRYRLYDIDRILSRTLSYAIVTVVLGGTFAVLVLLPTIVVGGRGGAPDYLIAIATLIVFGMFRPVRRRVQDTVDHRFNRARYDAEHTIEGFALRLREQIDIDALRSELRSVVGSAMQPEYVSLWLIRTGGR
jgi:hypothetical protein